MVTQAAVRLALSKARVLSNPEEVAPYVAAVQSCADKERDALGFIPKQAYEEAASNGKLFVAISGKGPSKQYSGHLIFGGGFPHARIFQLFVKPEWRGHGVARRLVAELVTEMRRAGFLT